jgi:polyhydroxyalkanoate synthase
VHVVGWSLGGIFALLTAADQPDLPIASLTTVGSPTDVTQVPLVAPIRPFLGLAGERAGLVTQAYRLMGGAPKPLVRRAFQLSSFNKLVTKPIAIAAKLDDADFLAQVEAVDRFTANMIAYPGRTFGQLYHRILKGNQLATGTVTMDDREIKLSNLSVPLLAFAGASDGIAPVQCVRPVVDLVPNVAKLRFEIVPGGHLGMLTGRAARTTTWRIIDEWVNENSTPEAAPGGGDRATTRKPARKSPAKKTSAKKPPAARKTPAKKAPAAKKATAPKPRASTAPSADAIGANPDRRYASASSRGLAAKK